MTKIGGLVNRNGTGNKAKEGSIALGTGLYAEGEYQVVTGRYNLSNTTDMVQIGSGTANNRQNGFSVDSEGVPRSYGGEIYIVNPEGTYVPIFYAAESDAGGNPTRIEKVLLPTQ